MMQILMPFIDVILAGLGGILLVLLGMLKYKNERIKSKDKTIKELEIDKEIMKEELHIEKFDAEFANPLKELDKKIEKANKKELDEKDKLDNSIRKSITI